MNDATYRPPGVLQLPQALQTYDGPWTQRQAAHLSRRAGFGSTPAELARLTAGSMSAAVDAYLGFAQDGSAASVTPPEFADPRVVDDPMAAGTDKAALQKLRNEAYRRDLIAMQLWWLNRMVAGPAPLQEKLTVFWHGHFTSAYREKGSTPADMLRQNSLFRQSAAGDIRALTLAVSQDPAMLRYLDNARSSKAHPNENYARELMELFTLGIGNYSETDIRESARAFTGWTVNRQDEFVAAPARHDQGSKTFLGQTGNFDGTDIINIIFEQPACARLFAGRLLEFFVYSQPEPQLVEAVAAQLRRHNYQLAPVLSMLFRSNLFYSDRAYRALVKSPVEFVVGGYRMLNLPTVKKAALGTLLRSGQVLFHPPNVKGWDGGIAWLNSQTLLTRENFSATLVRSPELADAQSVINQMPLDAPAATAKIVDLVLQGDVSQAAATRLHAYLDGADTAVDKPLSTENFAERIRGGVYLAMAMPAYQLN